MELNLTANGTEQTVIKEYLEQNTSDILAEKINNGVLIEQEGKKLLNKKTLDGFMKFANEEARKQASKGANCACVRDDVVFGWAVHYFEEKSIIGTLYNEDGSEYKKAKPVTKKAANTTTATPVIPIKKEPVGQVSMFDIFDEPTVPPTIDEDEKDKQVTTKEANEPVNENIALTVNTETGEVIEEKPICSDEFLMAKLYELLGNDIEFVR